MYIFDEKNYCLCHLLSAIISSGTPTMLVCCCLIDELENLTTPEHARFASFFLLKEQIIRFKAME
jgi:hypothetical protein